MNFRGDDFEDALQVLRDVRIPKAKHDDTTLREPAVATCIVRLMRCVRVLTPIKFDGEAQGRAIEIEHVWSGRMLSTEIGAKLAISKLLPEPHFDIGGIASETSRARSFDGSPIE